MTAVADRPEVRTRTSFSGIATVFRLEVRQRLRSTRWQVALGVFFGIVTLVAVLLNFVGGSGGWDTDGGAGRWIFGLTTMFVLFMGLASAPTLSSTSINGDRNAGVLALLQMTTLTAWDLVLGKLFAAWVAALAFLAVSLPAIVWGAVLAQTSILGLVRMLLVVAVLLGVVCAIGLGFSALTAKTAGSSVLTYLAVAGLAVITVVLFALSVPLVARQEQVPTLIEASDGTCREETRESYVTHTERTWWLLALNPFVITADAAPAPRPSDNPYGDFGPLDAIRSGVAFAREGTTIPVDLCFNRTSPDVPTPERSPVWPWGLGAQVALGGLALVVAARRLTVPYRRLAPGQRVA